MKKTKSNANVVGADSISAQKGITLIALIITIIVMLILVGVTVSIAINGGLFSTAKEAANKTQIEIDREALQSAVLGALTNEGTIDFTKLDANLPTGFTGSNRTYTSASGNKFKVSSDGNITYKEQSTGDLALLEEYCLDKEFAEVYDSDTETFINNDVISNAETEITLLNLCDIEIFEGNAIVYLKYNNKGYKLIVDPDTEICEEVELIYTPNGREGETVAYDGDNDGTAEEWVILYDNGDNVEIVSKENMGRLTLGYNDEEAQEVGDIDGDGTENANLDKAIYSYNNAITRLNSYCESLIKNTNRISVRSVGSNPDDSTSEGGLFESDTLESMNSSYNGLGKSGDKNFEQDYVRMCYHNCISSSENYWLASRYAPLYKNYGVNVAAFVVCEVQCDSDNLIGGSILWAVEGSTAGECESGSIGVRPVVKVSGI